MIWKELLSKLLLRLMPQEDAEPDNVGVVIFATDDGKGHGASCDSPCSVPVALGIVEFLNRLYPERRNRILLMGDPADEYIIVPGS